MTRGEVLATRRANKKRMSARQRMAAIQRTAAMQSTLSRRACSMAEDATQPGKKNRGTGDRAPELPALRDFQVVRRILLRQVLCTGVFREQGLAEGRLVCFLAIESVHANVVG